MSYETQKLELRKLTSDDAKDLFELIQRNDVHLTKLGDYKELIARSEGQLASEIDQSNHELQFGIFLNDGLIGSATLIKYSDTTFGIGYWIDQSYTGKGLTTEAVRRLIAYAKNEKGAEEIWAGIKQTNEPSIRLVKRLGFELARTQPSHLSFQLKVVSGE